MVERRSSSLVFITSMTTIDTSLTSNSNPIKLSNMDYDPSSSTVSQIIERSTATSSVQKLDVKICVYSCSF